MSCGGNSTADGDGISLAQDNNNNNLIYSRGFHPSTLMHISISVIVIVTATSLSLSLSPSSPIIIHVVAHPSIRTSFHSTSHHSSSSMNRISFACELYYDDVSVDVFARCVCRQFAAFVIDCGWNYFGNAISRILVMVVMTPNSQTLMVMESGRRRREGEWQPKNGEWELCAAACLSICSTDDRIGLCMHVLSTVLYWSRVTPFSGWTPPRSDLMRLDWWPSQLAERA